LVRLSGSRRNKWHIHVWEPVAVVVIFKIDVLHPPYELVGKDPSQTSVATWCEECHTLGSLYDLSLTTCYYWLQLLTIKSMHRDFITKDLRL
jgi:hypothetical protein